MSMQVCNSAQLNINSFLEDDAFFENYLIFDAYKMKNEKVIFTTSIKIISKDENEIFYDDEINAAINKLKDNYQEVLKLRIQDGLTLADTGVQLSLTRERVRQIEEQVIRKLSTWFPNKFLLDLKQKIEDKKILFLSDLPVKNEELKQLVCNVISHKKFRNNFIFDKSFETIIISREYTWNNIKLNIRNFMISIEDAVCTINDLHAFILYLYPKQKTDIFIKKLISDDEISRIEKDKVFFKNIFKTKREKVEYIYTLFKDGFETKKNVEVLREKLNNFFPDIFTNDKNRAITGLADGSPNIYLWDWGKYIHIKHIQDVLLNYDFTDILKYIDNELNNVLAVDLDRFYELNKTNLVSLGIPSKYALHTLLKLKYPNDYSYQDSPRISSSGTERLDLSKVLLNVMVEKRTYTLEELMRLLNSPRDRILQLVERIDDIITVDTFIYIKKENVKISTTILEDIILYVNKQVKELNFLYIGLIIDKFRDQLFSISQYNMEIALIDLLKKSNLKKDFNISNHRIVDSSYPITKSSLNFHYIIEQFMGSKNTISKNELFNYFFIRGLNLNNIMNYYIYSNLKKIVRINEDTFIKLDSIGLHEDKIRSITFLVENKYKENLHIDEFIENIINDLPKISVSWNRYILSDILDKNIFKVMPSTENPQYLEAKNKE